MVVNLARPRHLPISFETERLFVRRYILGDTKRLLAAATESVNEMYPFLPWCHPDYGIEDARSWIRQTEPQWTAGNAYSFAIYDKNRETLHGGCGLNRVDEHPVFNLGYWVRTSSTGNRYAAEATIGLMKFAFRHLDIGRIEIIMSTRNTASRAVAEQAGATYEGCMKNRLLIHGQYHDAWLYSLTPDAQSAIIPK